ncbi:hypothetical protein [Actinoplanes sp. NBRC 103695]|uniref:hypothetical protein n=1 Tax=Actinoplanes sp. NBRC 103695 TaxID=3032202 RepID=UPI00255606AF|nr:hypothetical protein [Actinoplanes sp. NBRC 103695]
MNRTERTTTETGSHAIEQLADRPPATARDVHQVLPRFAEQGIPVPLSRMTVESDTGLNVNGEWYRASS